MRLLIALLLISFAGGLHAAVVAVGESDGVKISLTNEPCKLEVVSNPPFRATWEEKGQKYEGCYGISPLRLVMAYFSTDRTVAVMPIQMFKPVTNT